MTNNRSSSSRGPGTGQALVEFALVAPIFLLIVFAILQLGLLFGGQNGLVNGVRDTARYASAFRVITVPEATSACPAVLAHMTTVLGPPRNEVLGFSSGNLIPSVTYTWHQQPDTTDGPKWYVQVKVKADYMFPLYVPLVSTLLDAMDGTSDQKLRLSAQEEMRIENDPLPPIAGQASWIVTC
jgi:Flp pilus assembly protein TadG